MARLDHLALRLAAANARLKDMEARMTQLQVDLDDAERIAERTQKIDDRLTDLRALVTSPNLAVNQLATLPSEPLPPCWLLGLALGGSGGVLIGLVLALRMPRKNAP